MTVLFGTLGWRPQSLLPSIRSTSHLDRVAFYHSDHAKSRDARAKVVDFCRGLGVPCTAVEVSDAYDLLQVAGQIRADVRKEKSAGMDLRFNIAGGTRLMSSAALLVCILEGIPATYVHDETYRELALPLLGGRDSFRSPAFRRLRSFEPSLQGVRVNPFDFGNCLRAIENVVEREREKGPVRISATGGPKILTTAAILAAFHEGVETWY